MGFLVEDKAQLARLKKGDAVEFELRAKPDADGNYVISRIGPQADDRRAHPLVDRQPLPRPGGDGDARGVGNRVAAAHAARCDSRTSPTRRSSSARTFPGRRRRIVEDQVTYPLATTMMSVPGAKTVRGYSMFGDSFVYVLFEDGTDLYWARSRVLEYLNQVQSRLPAEAKPALGPDATGVGWIYQYALVDRSGRHDLGQLRALQDWFLQVRAEVGSQRRRSRLGRRHGAPVPDRALPRAAARLRHSAFEGDRRGAGREPRDRRLGARAGRSRVHGARERLPEDAGGLRRDSPR